MQAAQATGTPSANWWSQDSSTVRCGKVTVTGPWSPVRRTCRSSSAMSSVWVALTSRLNNPAMPKPASERVCCAVVQSRSRWWRVMVGRDVEDVLLLLYWSLQAFRSAASVLPGKASSGHGSPSRAYLWRMAARITSSRPGLIGPVLMLLFPGRRIVPVAASRNNRSTMLGGAARGSTSTFSHSGVHTSRKACSYFFLVSAFTDSSRRATARAVRASRCPLACEAPFGALTAAPRASDGRRRRPPGRAGLH